MSRPAVIRRNVRNLSRPLLARAPRREFREFRHPREMAELFAKRAMKAAALRDCGRRCVYCAIALCAQSATLDHVYPRAKGGPHVPGNVVAACGACNRMKADMLPAEFFMRYPWAGQNFMRYARAVHRALKRNARRAVSLAYAA
jgi:5-methylcytosine-specific restriction endonuclease McrA